ncbi:hypothetical protein [Polyangium mundeleinium]|uniref:Uncharacterized protein n=1 Tax=Polyangium mundeleinium TaxID=2995306 RepID=A0ABT5F629_9BACT|nr:hypothetical protein [Polyangium mundeleinium]MDC0748942.1 hypothetical protein [Polyangium mundeleinium]
MSSGALDDFAGALDDLWSSRLAGKEADLASEVDDGRARRRAKVGGKVAVHACGWT